MSGFMRKAALVVGAVALVAATAGAAAPLLAPGMAGAAGITGVASAATLTAIGTYGGLAAGVLTAISTATAPGLSSQGSATSFQTNPQSGLPYAMGRTRMSGLRIYANTNTRPGYTKFNDLLWFGAMLSIGGAIGGIEKFTADNEIVSFDASGNAIGDYHDYQGQKIHLGGQQTSALALSLVGGSAPGWTTAHKLSGITHAMWCLRFNKQGEMYGASAPEPAWIGNWVKVYDPRLDSTYPGGSGSCRALVESTYVWSDNPGLHALTWALGRWQNGKRTCGIGAPVANIRVAEFVECANVCEANGWKVGGVEWTTDSKWDTLKRILQAGGAIPTQTGAMVGCLVSTPRTAIATIESRHLLDSLSIAATKSRRDRFNSVIPRYVDENSDWSVISGTAITVSDYVTADKGQRTKEIDYPLVQVFSGQVAKQPGQLAAYDIVNSREAGPINFTTGPEWIGLKTGDVILLNVPEEGLVNQPVLITRRAPDPSTGKVSFSAQTETYAKHAYALGQSTTPPAPFSLTAPDLKPPAPAAANWAAAGTVTGEGLPAIVLTGNSEMPSADAVLIDYKLPADATWTRSAILSANEPVQHVIAPLQSETAYQVRVGYRVEQIDGDFTILAAVTTGVGIISDISGTIGQQQDQLEQLEQDAAAAQTNIAAAQAQIAAIQSSVSADLSELTAQIGTIDTSLDTLAAQVGTVTTDLASLQNEVGTVAGNLSSLQNQVGTVGTDLASLKSQVGTVSGNLSSLQSEVGSISADLGSLETTVAAQGGTISTHSNQISAANAAISANATAISTTNTNLASLTTRVGTAEATISTQQTAITSLQGSTASLSTLVTTASGNLLQNSEISPSSDGWSTYTNQSGVIFALNGMPAAYLVSGINALTIQQTDATATGYAEWNQPGIPLEPNSVNDVSVWCLAHRCLVQVYLQWKLADGSTGTAESPGTYSPGSGGTNLSLWGRYVFKAQAPANAVAATLIFRKFGTTSGSNSFAAFCRPQIRRTTASAAQGLPYTPSGNAASILSVLSVTQTQAGQISTLSTSLATANANISTNATAISTANGNISSLTTRVSSAESAISSNATALTNVTGRTATLETTVSAQGASISALQTATSTASGEIATLKTQVTAGGGNLLVNTDLALDTSGWIFNSGIGGSGGRNLPDASWYPATENVLTIVQANSTASGQSDWTQNIALQGDKWYDVSVGAASHRANIQVYLQCIDASGNVLATGTTGLIAPAGGGNTLASFPVCKFKIQAPAATVRGILYLRKFGTLSDANSYAWFLRPQVAETTATKASPVAYSVGSARATIVTQATAITTLNTQYASLSTTVSTQGASISTLQSTTTTQGGSISTLQTQMSTANANISTNATAISTANGNISSLTTRV
ncbi:hypothetical protein, partial [Sphingobium yanoikuyae]|uniref:hypothetical protein n=1 Tax=Sphingobium yanoikuyae TaxID=13690 RepID=UPI0035C79B3E